MTTFALAVVVSAAAPAYAAAWDRMSGQDSAIETLETTSAACDADWAALWERHQAGKIRPKGLPAADFTKETVVAVFLGKKSRGGYTVELDVLRDPLDRGRLNVIYRVVAPGRDRFSTEMVSRPFVILKVPGRFAPVVFEPQQKFKILDSAWTPEADQKVSGLVGRLGRFAAEAKTWGLKQR